jgi:hypothetical protein
MTELDRCLLARYISGLIVCVLLVGCGGDYTSAPPEEVNLQGDTARVEVPGSGDVQGHELVNIRWEEVGPQTKQWFVENGFEHRSTEFDTERMQAIGYERLTSEDQTGVRLFGVSLWVRKSSGD